MSPALQQRLGVEGTVGLLELFDTARHEWTAQVTTVALDQFERRLTHEATNLRSEMKALGSDLRGEMRDLAATLRAEMRDGDNGLRLEIRDLRNSMIEQFSLLRQENAAGRFEMMKWCFLFWVGQFFAVATVLGVVVRGLRP